MVPVAEACAVPVSTHCVRSARRSDGGLRQAPRQIAGNALTSIFQPLCYRLSCCQRLTPNTSGISGVLVGLLISLPDAFAMKSYAGILGTGLIFSVLAGYQNWVS